MSKTYLVTKDDLRTELLKLMRDGVDLNPIGTIISFMGTQPPITYLPCDGHQYVIEDYQELAEFITVQFGVVNYFGGDGERYFAVPSLGGEFLRGAGVNTHVYNGNGTDVGVHQDATRTVQLFVGGGAELWSDTGIEYYPQNVDSVYDTNPSGKRRYKWNSSGNWGESPTTGAYYTSRPTNTSVLFCIKAKSGDEQ